MSAIKRRGSSLPRGQAPWSGWIGVLVFRVLELGTGTGADLGRGAPYIPPTRCVGERRRVGVSTEWGFASARRCSALGVAVAPKGAVFMWLRQMPFLWPDVRPRL